MTDPQDRWTAIETAHAIVQEECDKIQDTLFAAIQVRVKAELGNSVKIVKPKRTNAYAARSGPKVTKFPSVDINTHERQMVMPVCWIEGRVKPQC